MSVRETSIEFTRAAVYKFGKIDVWFPMRRIARQNHFHLAHAEEWDHVMNSNVQAFIGLLRQVVPLMIDQVWRASCS